jgi:hypothetical protein
MKKVIQNIWKILNSRIALYIGIIVVAILFAGTCSRNSSLKDELDRKDRNISALNDSITTIKLKNGELQSSRDAYMASAKELEKFNKELSDEVKSQKGKIVTLNRIVFQLKQDTTDLREYIRNLPDPEPPVQDDDSTWTVSWSTSYVYDSTNYDRYDGKTQVRLRGPFDVSNVSVAHQQTYLTFRDSQIGLTWGQKWEGTGKDKKLRVYAQTAHPAFKTKLLEGVYVDYPQKRHWFTGFGVGPQLGLGYNPFTNGLLLYGGVGIHYNFYQW